jgi:hypothetical protein
MPSQDDIAISASHSPIQLGTVYDKFDIWCVRYLDRFGVRYVVDLLSAKLGTNKKSSLSDKFGIRVMTQRCQWTQCSPECLCIKETIAILVTLPLPSLNSAVT